MYTSDSQQRGLGVKAMLGCHPHVRALGLQGHPVLTTFSPAAQGSGGSLAFQGPTTYVKLQQLPP